MLCKVFTRSIYDPCKESYARNECDPTILIAVTTGGSSFAYLQPLAIFRRCEHTRLERSTVTDDATNPKESKGSRDPTEDLP